VFSGTLCTSGEAEALVYATGMGTQLGRIAALSQRVRPETSPLQRQVNRTAQLLAIVAVVVACPCGCCGQTAPSSDARALRRSTGASHSREFWARRCGATTRLPHGQTAAGQRSGDPTESGLLVAAAQLGENVELLSAERGGRRRRVHHFDPGVNRMTTLDEEADGRPW
jgi:magnesium-transporting ATPase (P-type)